MHVCIIHMSFMTLSLCIYIHVNARSNVLIKYKFIVCVCMCVQCFIQVFKGVQQVYNTCINLKCNKDIPYLVHHSASRLSFNHFCLMLSLYSVPTFHVALKIYACIIHLLYSFKHLDKTLYTHAYTHYKFVLYQYIWPCIEVSDDIVYMNITGDVSSSFWTTSLFWFTSSNHLIEWKLFWKFFIKMHKSSY
jgi:hypothetical protein